MKIFWSVLLAGSLVAGGYYILQKRDRAAAAEAFVEGMRTGEARDSIATWSVRLESTAAGMGEFGPVADYLEAYRAVRGWLPHLPAAERGLYERILSDSRATALSRLRAGGPEWQQVSDATR